MKYLTFKFTDFDVDTFSSFGYNLSEGVRGGVFSESGETTVTDASFQLCGKMKH